MSLKGNKGEWGEIYAFCKLLSSGKLQTADKDLQPIEGVYFPIIKIIRETFFYSPESTEDENIKIYQGDKLYGEFSKDELDNIINILYSKIPLGKRAFEIPESNEFFDKIKIDKLKAESSHKQDITIQIHDINTGISPICGFSIKSYLGSNPTLVNAGKNTNFIYEIPGCNDEVMNAFNSINSKNKLIERMNYLSEQGLVPLFTGEISSARFKINMKFIDTKMPEIIGEALLNYYSSGVSSRDVKEVVEEISEHDLCDLGDKEMYKYKIKQFLCACALGMTPEKEWTGGEDANGGYITVKKDGSVVCYHIYNRVDFLEYLYNYTYFEKGSSSRHEYMSVFESNGKYYLCLNLQVRFKNL